jgi:hypothetical protein
MGDKKAVVKNADMAEDMQQDAVDCATQVSTVPSVTCVIYRGRNEINR